MAIKRFNSSSTKYRKGSFSQTKQCLETESKDYSNAADDDDNEIKDALPHATNGEHTDEQQASARERLDFFMSIDRMDEQMGFLSYNSLIKRRGWLINMRAVHEKGPSFSFYIFVDSN